MKNKQCIKVLLIEDNRIDARLIRKMLYEDSKDSNVISELFHADQLSKGFEYLERERIDVILLDLGLADSQGMDTLRLILSREHQIPIIVVTGLTDKELAIRTVKAGAQDYLIKGQISSSLLNRSIVYAIERKRIEQELHQSEERYRTILKNVEDGYYEVDHKGNFTFFNDSMCRILGYSPEEMMGMNNQQLTDKENAKKLFQAFNKVYKTGKSTKEFDWQIIRKDGTKIYIEASVSLQNNSSGKPIGFQGIARDITERKRAEDELRESEHRYQELSIIDDLTQLYNSRHFYVQLEREIERSNRYEQPLTLLLMDLDKFKEFNDMYGHIEGDHVLSRLGQVVKRCLRETDSAYRYGGEEFVVILPMTTSEEGIVTAKRIQTELMKEAFSPVSDQNIYMTVSIGISQYRLKEEMKSFVHRVDQLMYKAKKNGRDRICPES